MQPSSTKSVTGFTLIELLFGLGVIGILCVVAASSVSAAVNAARTSSGRIQLLAALTLSRAAAVDSGTDVILCPSFDGASCASSEHWESGWIAFEARHAGTERDSDDPVVLRQGALARKVHLVSTKGRTRIRFQSTGSNGGSNATFTFCDGRGPRAAAAYAMSNPGRLREATPEAENVAEACADL